LQFPSFVKRGEGRFFKSPSVPLCERGRFLDSAIPEELFMAIPPKREERLNGMLGVDCVDVFCIGTDGLGKAPCRENPEALPIALPESLDKLVGHGAISLKDAGFHAFAGIPPEERFGSSWKWKSLGKEGSPLAERSIAGFRSRDDHSALEDSF